MILQGVDAAPTRTTLACPMGRLWELTPVICLVSQEPMGNQRHKWTWLALLTRESFI